jgi:Zn-dependent protease with chaperone function
LLVFLSLACLPEPGRDWPEPPWGSSPWAGVVLTALGVGLAVLSAAVVTLRARRAVGPGGELREADLVRYERARSGHQLLLIGLYVISLLVFGWGHAVGVLWRAGDRLLPGAELVVLAPFLVSLLLSWACFYDAERSQWGTRHLDGALENGLSECEGVVEAAAFTAVARPTVRVPDTLSSRWRYVLFQARQRLALVCIPLGLLLIQKEVGRLVPAEVWPRGWAAIQVLGFVAVVAAFVAMPWIIRLALGLTPLPDSPLKRRLLDTVHRLGFRCSGLLLWNTRRGMANAMVVGILPWPRYVIFTDRLLEEFTAEEVEAVLGHEIGHLRHRHMQYYLAFLMASLCVMYLVADKLIPQAPEGQAAEVADAGGGFWTLHNHPYLKAVPAVGAMLAYIFVVFGFVSRRCERQADVFGCRAVSCPRPDCHGHDPGDATGEGGHLCPTGVRTVIRALEKVAVVNGISRDRPGFLQSWQHSTIAKRVDFLERVMQEPAAEPRFQRRVLLMKYGLLLLLGLALAVLWPGAQPTVQRQGEPGASATGVSDH